MPTAGCRILFGQGFLGDCVVCRPVSRGPGLLLGYQYRYIVSKPTAHTVSTVKYHTMQAAAM